jgi:hypothetical protein
MELSLSDFTSDYWAWNFAMPSDGGETWVQIRGDLSSLNAAPVPEPATMLLVGSGLIGLAGYGRKKFFKK